jgi:type IX secretion system PorP/SprF family membrane protein
VLGLSAQQTPQYSQYMFNYFSINPAMAGTKECLDLKLGYRSQWVGFAGAPKTTFATLSSRLKFKKASNPYVHHGVGVKVESDVMGLTSATKLYLAYAYHFTLGRDLKASAGIFGGLEQFRFNVNAANAWQGPDPAIHATNAVVVWPDFTPGIFIYSKKAFYGLNVRQLLSNGIKKYGTGVNKLRRHYEFLGGAKIAAGETVSYLPSAMIKFTSLSVPAIDLNFLLDFDNRAQFGISYRNVDALVGMFKVNFLKHFTLGYAFDFTTSRVKLGSSNTHEITIGIYSCDVRGGDNYSCPAFD